MLWKNQKWLLLPACFVLGLLLLFAFVSYSQQYLSEYLVRNSKELIGQKVDLARLSDHLQESRIPNFSKNHGGSEIVLVFWSVTCAPCLQSLGKLTQENPLSLVVAVNTDPEDQLDQARQTQENLAGALPFHYDRGHKLQEQFRIDYLPTHVRLDQNGFIKKFEVGARN